MRLPFPTLILSVTALFILSPSLVSSIHPYALSRREHSLSSSAYVLSSRQHRVARDLLDVCINANVSLATDAPQLLGLGSLLGDLDLGTDDKLCLCLKDLNLYLDTNDNVQALVGLLGKNAVSTLITALINTSPNSKQCTFPSNAHHTCNNSDPCHYECDTGYVQNGDACVCALPNISCNGVCGSFPQGCGSARPKDRRSEPVYTLSQAQRRCQSRESVCGIPGKLGTLAFECIDTKITKDSCGGCVASHSFLDKSPQVLGKDCTSISHVLSSSCVESQCIVNSCTDGFVPSLSKDICIPSPGSLTKMRRMRRRDVQSSNPIIPTTVHAPVAESDNPIVVGLSDLLSGLQLLGPVKSNATVDGLGSGLSDTVNPLLNGVNIGPNNAKRRATSETVNSTISSELRSQMEGLFDLVLALEDSMSLLPPPGSDATASLDDQSELGVARAMGQLLQSKTTAALLSNIDAFINAVSTLQSQFNSCGCVETLGLDRASNILGLIAESADGMKNWCAENSIVPPTPADPSPTSLGPLLPTGNVSPQAPPTRGPGTAAKSGDVPIFIGLDNLLQELGLGSTGIITADGLGDGMDSTVNNLLDSLAGIGPSGVRARQDLMREHKGGARGSHILSARQLAAAATASVESDLLGEVIALVDSVLGLKNISRSLLSALPALTPSNDNPPALISSSKPTGTEVPALPPPNSASVLGSNLVDSILQATLGLLTAQTYTSAVGESEALVSQSISSLEALTSCNCIEELGLGGTYEYLSGILDAALALQDLLQKTSGVLTPTTSSGPIAVGGASMIPATYSTRSTARSAPTGSPSTGLAGTPPSTDDSASSTGDKPLIVGLTKLLNGLGVNITANVVVDNLLGDDLDHSLNSLLNGMGIGPNGVAA